MKRDDVVRQVEVTREQCLTSWHDLFDRHPDLEGMTASGSCNRVFCCPPTEDLDWAVLSRVETLLWFLTGDTQVDRLSRSLVPDAREDVGG
jgi:hypothetical protein